MQTLEKAKVLRKTQTETEQWLWQHLRAHRLQGLKFKRQKPLGHYIVDFVCPASRLIIELDGGHHADQQDYDAIRTDWLNSQGYHVLGFWNHEILNNLHGVLDHIHREAVRRQQP